MAILPTERTIDWSTAGVIGGIPTRSTISQTADAATYGNDSTAAQSHLQTKINATTPGQVCYIPAGTYRISSSLVLPSNITVRGDVNASGFPTTIIKTVGTSGSAFVFGNTMDIYYNTSYDSRHKTVSSGATLGSTQIVLTSATNVAVGKYLVVTELNDTYVSNVSYNGTANWVDVWDDSGARARGQIVKVTGVSGTTVDFTPALYTAYSRTPDACLFTEQCAMSGIENIEVYATNSGTVQNFLFQTAANCWLYNVKSNFADGNHLVMDFSWHCEVRHCWFEDQFVHGSGNFDGFLLRGKTTGSLIADSVFYRLHTSIILEWGAAGNVIAYNYCAGEFDNSASSGARWLPPSIDINHGAHPQFNLCEGNFAQKIVADGYWGTSSHNTYLRNWATGRGTTYPPYSARGAAGTVVTLNQDTAAIQLWEGQSKHSVIGNILGNSAGTGSTYKISSPTTRSYSSYYIWNLGYATSTDTGGLAILANPDSTYIDHGNYSFATGTGNGQTWDGTIADHTIPDSYFLAAKPSWFGDRVWPAFSASTVGTIAVTDIPAGYRYTNLAEVPAAGGDTTAPTISITTPTSDATLTVTSGTISSVAGTAADNVAVSTVTWTNDRGGSGTATGTTSWSIANVVLAQGINIITVTATDSSGNTASDIITVTYDVTVNPVYNIRKRAVCAPTL